MGKESTEVSPKIPLPQHYANERKIRVHIFRLQNRIRKLKEQLTFSTKDLERAALKFQNKLISLRNRKVDLQIRVAQRETGAKFNIDHDEAWRAFYHSRLLVNKEKLHKALPDERVGLTKLVEFDTE